MEKQIVYYYTKNGKCPYKEWLNDLDASVQLRELRLDFGAGYRIYYYDLKDTLILFVAGSNKKEQDKVIKQANTYFKDFKERNYIND